MSDVAFSGMQAVRIAQRFGWPDWFHDAVTANHIITRGMGKYAEGPASCDVNTPEGVKTAHEGDWVTLTDGGALGVRKSL
jgi:hypothetical protein